jgi:hypothetical protein
MAKAEVLQPVYDDKVKKILQLLEEGFTREEVAEKFRYSTYRSMDEFMRRKNFLWDKREEVYVPADVVKNPLDSIVNFPTDKVRRVVTELNKEGANPKEVAMKVGFENHLDMAGYMKFKGFEWSQETGNYVSTSPQSQVVALSDSSDGTDTSHRGSFSIGGGGEDFLPLLEWLAANKHALQGLLGESVATGQIPRFALPGLFVTKSVHMTNTLDQMVRDFSKEKNINQREIFEVALIEFFQKYGYAREVETLL